jgi:hypothetical protein
VTEGEERAMYDEVLNADEPNAMKTDLPFLPLVQEIIDVQATTTGSPITLCEAFSAATNPEGIPLPMIHQDAQPMQKKAKNE